MMLGHDLGLAHRLPMLGQAATSLIVGDSNLARKVSIAASGDSVVFILP